MADAARGLVHVLVYDSMCTSLDEDTEKVILNLFQRATTGSVTIEMIKIQHQDPRRLTFVQGKMRNHLARCFENKLFPI